ncbi:hypothetical protein [Sinorhizobium medicae]|nr:hypothetical protein [Sinorhizobium medicae]
MARKVKMQSIGTPAVLKIVETDVGSPGAGQVRLEQILFNPGHTRQP